ncbi:hypothetical protein OEZ86_000713 [Tetradesmus obliquus]|nr:hypothetical protein OEZ86_000713 [Tetradesmus obliquus]
MSGAQLVKQRMLDTRVNAEWGNTSLVEAFLDSMAEILQRCNPGGLRHIVLSSGHDIPLQLLPAGHLPAGVTMYGSYDYGADDTAALQAVMYRGMLDAGFAADEARAWAGSLVPHHQWLIVSVEHALVLVALRDKILQVAKAVHKAWSEQECGIAADEYIILTALRWAGCIRGLQKVKWLTQHWRQKLQPGTAANCCPTQVIYPLPSGWTVLEGRLQLPAAAAASAAAAAGKAAGSSSTRGSRAGSPEQQQQGLTLEEFHELQVAASDAAKHPVTWRSMQEKVWCEDERHGRMLAISLSLRQLLAMASQRRALLLRKVDMRSSCSSTEEHAAGSRKTQEQQLLELLAQMWLGNAPKLTSYKEVLIFDKEAH